MIVRSIPFKRLQPNIVEHFAGQGMSTSSYHILPVFNSNSTRTLVIVSSYPVPGRKVTALKKGKGGDGFIFSIFLNGKKCAVKDLEGRCNGNYIT